MRRLLAIGAMLLVSSAVGAQDQVAMEGPYSAVFRGVPLGEALEEIVHLTEIDLVFSSDLVTSHLAYCSRRRVDAEELLRCVLAGTGLDFVRSSSGAYVIIVAPEQSARLAYLAGRVVDADSGEPMPYAHVMLADAGTVADRDGHFSIAGVLPGEHRLVATYVGYEATVIDSLWIEPGSRERMVVGIRPSAAELSPIVVDGLTQRLPSGGLGRVEGAFPYAGTGVVSTPDVIRGAAGTIGVSSAIPLADLHIQGGNTSEHLTRLDGVPVRDPVALGRYLGAFSPLAVRHVTVHKAGFGASEGSMIAGAIDVRHDAHAIRPSLSLQVDPIATNVRAATPIGEQGSVMIALRRSVWEAYGDVGIGELLRDANRIDPLIAGFWVGESLTEDAITTLSSIPRVSFSDVHATVRLAPDPYSSLQASVYRAGNFVAADHQALIPYRGEPHEAAFHDEYDWANWAGQARFSRILGSRTTFAVRARASHHASSYIYEYGLGSGGNSELFGQSDSGHRLVEAGLDAELGVSLSPGRDVDFGISADWIDARFHGENALIQPFSVEMRQMQLSAYAQGRAMLGSRTTLEAGARLTGLPGDGSVYAEPRGSIRYDGEAPGVDGFALRLAGGIYRQFVNGFAFPSLGPAALVPELWFWLPASPEISPPRAYHVAAEGLLLPAPRWTIRAETYVRWEPNLLALDVPAVIAADLGEADASSVTTAIEGRAIGAGLGVQWTSNRLSLAATYSFEQSRRTTPTRPQALAVPWEEPHRLSIDGRMRLGGGFSIEAAGRGVWGRSWGLRRAYYEYLGDASPSLSERLADPENDRLPPLLVADGKVVYRNEIGFAPIRLELGLANLFDRRNVVDWSLETGGQTDGLLPRLLPGRRVIFAIRADF